MYLLETENIVLGQILVNGELIKECKLVAECFSKGRSRELFNLLKGMADNNEPIDFLTAYNKKSGGKEKADDYEYLKDLADAIPTTANFDYYEKSLLDNYKYIQANEIFKAVSEGKLSIGQAGLQLTILDQATNEDDGDTQKFVDEAITDLYEGSKGIKTKFKDYDGFTKGLHSGDLVIIGARPSMGKTAFVLNMLNNIVKSDTNKDGCMVAMFSLEMGGAQLIKRLQGINSGIHLSKTQDAFNLYSEEDYKKANFTYQFLRSQDMKIYDNPSSTVFDIWAKVKKLRTMHGDDKEIVVMIDYLQLITSNNNKNRNEQVSEISRTLKIMARELNVCVIALSQLSRGVESRLIKKPVMSDLKESGSIEQDADVIGLLYREDYYDAETNKKNITELIITKNRNGAIGTVELFFQKEIGKFLNLEYRKGQEA